MTDEDESTDPGIIAAERAILTFLRGREANDAAREDRGTSTVNQLAQHPAPANPLKIGSRDLDHETKQVLDRTVARETGPVTSARLASFDRKRTELTPGTVLVREWDRQSQRVMVMAEGFAWNGQTYDSLSKVAFAITGTKWNGPRFFGLRHREVYLAYATSSRHGGPIVKIYIREYSFMPVGPWA
jgi:hypothetical protein